MRLDNTCWFMAGWCDATPDAHRICRGRLSCSEPGNQGRPIFWDEGDRHDFLKTLGEACRKTGFQIHAYCLMTNHFHLVVETPRPNLVAGMRWLLSTYTNRFNHRHDRCGHLFSGRAPPPGNNVDDGRNCAATGDEHPSDSGYQPAPLDKNKCK